MALPKSMCRSAPNQAEPEQANLEQAKLEYIEEAGLLLERFGLPRMTGRVLGALLLAEPLEQTAEELAATLQASRG